MNHSSSLLSIMENHHHHDMNSGAGAYPQYFPAYDYTNSAFYAVQRPVAMEATKPIVPTTEEEWAYVKDTIQQLYLEENLPLKDVVVIMRDHYHFKATERMYKTRFQHWGWKKYNMKPKGGEAQSSGEQQ